MLYRKKGSSPLQLASAYFLGAVSTQYSCAPVTFPFRCIFFAIDHQTLYEFYYLFSLLRAPHSIMDKQESLFPHV